MKLPMIRRNAVSKLLVTLLILWMNLDFSIGEIFLSDFQFDDDSFNQTDVDWLWESIVVLRWDIDNRPEVQYDNLRFDIDFTVSDFIQAEDHVRYTIYQNAICGNPDDIITNSDGYMESWITEDDTPIGIGLDMDSRRTVRISNQLNADTIAQSDSYKELPEGSISDASIKYCVRFSLWSNGPWDENAEELNHITVTVGLLLDLRDELFSISGQNIEALEEGVQTSEDQFFLQSFICDTDGNPRQDATPLNQGEVVRICVQPTEQASEVGFRMKKIDTFSFSQGVTSQAAILNGEVAANQLSNVWCEAGARQCVIESVLFAHFYQQQQVNILGSGEATLQWGGEGVDRRIQVNLETMRIETDDDIYDGLEFNWVENEERLLQDRASTKTMEVPKFVVLHDKQGRPPLRNKSLEMTQRIVLISLLFVFSVVLVIPIVCYFVREPEQESQPFELNLASPESECVIIGIPDDQTIKSRVAGDRTIASYKSSRSIRSNGSSRRSNEKMIVSRIPDDRTIASVKSSRSNRSKGSQRFKDQRIVSKIPEDRTVTSMKSSRSNRSRGSRVSKIPEDRTVASVKSSRSNRSRGSKGLKQEN